MQYRPLEVQRIALPRIDFGDTRYQTRLPWNSTPAFLQDLIQAAGIVTPLRLEARPSGDFRIVSGFRRFLVARELKMPDIPALTVQGEPERLFLSAVCENMSQNPALELSERAEIAVRLLQEFGSSENRVVAEVLPLLQLPATLHQLRRLRSLADMPETVRRVISGRLTLESAHIIHTWKVEDAEFFVDLVDRYQFGTNKQKQLLVLLEDLRRIEAASVREVWESSGASAIEGQEDLSPADRFRAFRQRLRRRRFPVLSEYEERAEQLQRSLVLPEEVQLRLPSFLEGDHIDVLLRVTSSSELRSVAGQLESVANRPEMNELFDLL